MKNSILIASLFAVALAACGKKEEVPMEPAAPAVTEEAPAAPVVTEPAPATQQPGAVDPTAPATTEPAPVDPAAPAAPAEEGKK